MSYLTVAEYIRRFGDRETTNLTNTTALTGGVVPAADTAKVQVAIDDSVEVVNSYLSTRYAMPISDPPNIVRGWVAALAREALHVNVGKTNDAVDGAANRARAQLKDAMNGLIVLPIAPGQTAPASSTGTASSSMDRPTPVFTPCAANAYTAPFTGGGYSPAWRNGGG